MAIGQHVQRALAEKAQKEQPVAEQTDTTADLKAQIALMQAQMEALLRQQPAADALQLLAERSAPKQNPNYNEVSPFTYPEGERMRPKPKLQRSTFFCGGREREEQLTPTEIDLYNRFSTTHSARGGTWTAELRQNGSAQELHINVPARSIDERMNLPNGLSLILLELLDGPAAADATRLAERVAELEKKLAAVA
jgi:hypothetical protein